jgi:hypothetical protein
MVIALVEAAAPSVLCLGLPMRHWWLAAEALDRYGPKAKALRRLATGFAAAFRHWAPAEAPTD